MTTDQTQTPRTGTQTPRTGTIDVSVNGASRPVPEDCTLDQLVSTLTATPSGVAAALNEDVVPRGAWSGTALREGDRVEILTAVQGG